MNKTLGIDIGPNSIGWAVIGDNQKILDKGVRVFEVGVENYGQDIGKEKSKNAARREHRLLRRGYYRKRLRKTKLLELLIKFDMCPLTTEQLKRWTTWDRVKKSEGLISPLDPQCVEKNSKLAEWLSLNPWQLRSEALVRDISRQEFGRILYHFVQRRGFLSSRKGAASEQYQKTQKKGKVSTRIKDFDDLLATLKSSDAKYPVTMGSILWDQMPKFDGTDDTDRYNNRARARDTKREFYVHELLCIWERQSTQLGLDGKNTVFDRELIKRYILTDPNSSAQDTETKKLRRNLKRLSLSQIKKKLLYLHNKINSSDHIKALINVNTNEFTLKKGKNRNDLESFLTQNISENSPNIVKIHEIETQTLKYALLGQASELSSDELGYQNIEKNLNPPSIRKSVLYWQRDLKPQKHLKLKCLLEPKKPVVPISHPLNEIRIIYEFINNIEVDNKKLYYHGDAHEKWINARDFLLSQSGTTIKFAALEKKLELGSYRVNYNQDQSAPGAPVIAELQKHSPKFKDQLANFIADNNDQEAYKYIVELWHYVYFYTDVSMLTEKLSVAYPDLSPTQIENISNISPREGYASLSQKAIKNILPFLQQGFVFSKAKEFAGVKNAMGDKWNIVESHKQRQVVEDVREQLKKIDQDDITLGPYTFLRHEFLGKLYHNSNHKAKKTTDAATIRKDIIDKITNPIVKKSLYQLLDLSLAIKQTHGEFDDIRLELARDVANGKEKRKNIETKNYNNKQENDKAEEQLKECKQRITKVNRDKIKLFNELSKKICPYTGRSIGFEQLFNGEIEIEHIMPRDRSLDNSFANKTLCYVDFNREKGNKTPHEFWESNKNKNGLWGSDINDWESFENRTYTLFKDKYKAKRMLKKEVDLGDFTSQQLNDTRYISKVSQDVLQVISKNNKKISVNRGQHTSELKHLWGLGHLLNPRLSPKSLADPLLFDQITSGQGITCIAQVEKINQTPEYSQLVPLHNPLPEAIDDSSLLLVGYGDQDASKDTDENTGNVAGQSADKDTNKKTSVLKLYKNTYNTLSYNDSSLDSKKIAKQKVWVELPIVPKNSIATKAYADRPIVDQHITLQSKITIRKSGTIKTVTDKQDIDSWLERNIKGNSGVDDGGNYYLVFDIANVALVDTKPKDTKGRIIYRGTYQIKQGIPYFCSYNFEYQLSEKDKENLTIDKKYYAIVTPQSITQVVKQELDPPITDNKHFIYRVKINQGQYSIASRSFAAPKGAQDNTWYWIKLKLKSKPIIHSLYTKAVEKNAIVGHLSHREGEITFAPETKNRGTHLHHALDAIIVACTDQSILSVLQGRYKGKDIDKKSNAHNTFAPPWPTFIEDVRTSLNSILVSHEKTLRDLNKGAHTMAARVQLHEDTALGKHGDLYHVRKPIAEIWEKEKRMEKIVHKKLVEQIKKKQGVYYQTTNKGINIPVRHLRVCESKTNTIQVGKYNKYFNSGGNHHMIVWKNKDKQDWAWAVVNNFESVKRKRMDEPQYQPAEYLYVFEKNDLYLLNIDKLVIEDYKSKIKELSKEMHAIDLQKYLYFVAKFSSAENTYVLFRHHTNTSSEDNTNNDDFVRITSLERSSNKSLKLYCPIKVEMDSMGKIINLDI